MIKRVVSKYELGDVIGRGAYSQVYRAHNIEDKQLYAIKVINNKLLAENAKVKECITNEINTHNSLGASSYIVQFKELLQTKNNCYFVYEYCEGGTLYEYLHKHRFLQEEKALEIFRQLLEAFKLLKKYSIMHRDVKPENILIKEGVFKLADFGFCKELGNQKNMTKTMLGSPLYMAPEVLRGESYTSNADIWSLGVILYEMLYGHCPFESNSIANLISKIDETNLSFEEVNNRVSQATKRIILGCLQKQQKNRIKWEDLFQEIINKPRDCFPSNSCSPVFSKSSSGINPRSNYSTLMDNNTQKSQTPNRNGSMLLPNSKSKYEIYKENYEKLQQVKQKTPNIPPLKIYKQNVLLRQEKFDELHLKNESEILPHNQSNQPQNSQLERNRSLSKYSNKERSKSKDLCVKGKEGFNHKYELIISHHECCVNILKKMLQKLEKKHQRSYKYCTVILKRVRQVLEKIYTRINLNETQMLPILSIIKYELIQIDKMQGQVESCLHSYVIPPQYQNSPCTDPDFPLEIVQLWNSLQEDSFSD